ncbi:uncharacterized protein LOC129617018 [Condylostylus longicornis]|uniref:uncharacterized protein LOC129617018 n=1 Tax=Condylostylus longicornis TaxID=2530218 RepID=UPI00244D9AE2|nr:uncharacterized protein LOC129617018 [Condylostylus longicornis]
MITNEDHCIYGSQHRESGALPGDVEEVSIVFGQSSGINGRLHQRWTACWENQTLPARPGSPTLVSKRVQKLVRQFEEDMETIKEVGEVSATLSAVFHASINAVSIFMHGVIVFMHAEWNETIDECARPLSEALKTEDSWTRRVLTIKSGVHKATGRTWKSVSDERFQQSVEGEELLNVTETLDEESGETKRHRFHRRERDGTERTEVRMSTIDGGRTVLVTDEWCRNSEGMKWGKKSGTGAECVFHHDNSNPSFLLCSDDEWHSTWFERPNGDREVVEWKRGVEGVRGEKSGFSHNGESYDERWETLEHPVGTQLERRSYSDKWWSGKGDQKWGEKSLKLEKIDEDSVMMESHVVREKWYDNTVEKSVDNWKVDKEFEKTKEGTSIPVRLVEHGYKLGDRYADGTEWGEHWGRVYEKGELEGKNLEEIESPRCDESEGVHGVVLRMRHQDKWWRETNGNKWGEKRFVDLKLNEERNENWYNNGKEEQVDRWEISEGGIRHGEKFGKAVDGSREWREKWSEKNDDFWIDKHWTEQQEGGRNVRWGEVEGKEGGKKWRQKWGEDKHVDCDAGHRYVEKWDDDGFGNIKTLKEGEDWVDGRTVNWFSDRYGESLGKGEKWAVKEGTTGDGDAWMEKWNESPDAKSAEKTGKNKLGDEWKEIWKETIESDKKIKWAEKTGKNPNGEEWLETWWEEGDEKKFAKKIGKNNSEEWKEEWGEESHPNGSGEKWTSKWARNRTTGEARGESWGDTWNGDAGGHHWGEKWNNDQVEKWWKDSAGKPDG